MKHRILILTLIMFTLTACGHQHTFSDATCTEPKTCTECQETEGEPLGHSFSEANCTEPATCTSCGLTEGEALGHSWLEATTEAPKTCEVCGLTDGEPLPAEQVEITKQETQAEAPTQHSPEYQKMLEDLVKEIYNSGDSYIPADPAVEAALGGTPAGNQECANDVDYNAPSNPKFAGGSLE